MAALAELIEEHIALKKCWGALNKRWVEPHVRDKVVDMVHYWEERADMKRGLFIHVPGLRWNKFLPWESRYGKESFDNGKVPRDYRLEDWERAAIANYYHEHREENYRCLTYRMLDEDIAAVSPATVCRALKSPGFLTKWNEVKPSQKGKGFTQPLKAHDHRHMYISYLNICGTFCYMIAVLDGFSRCLVHWDIRESMTEHDAEVVLQRARELFPNVRPRIITDNGPQFISKDFKEFFRFSGMSHVRTSPYYPQSNGKLERLYRTVKHECVRLRTPVSLEDAKHFVSEFVDHCNTRRLHSAIGFITPRDKLEGKDEQIFDARDAKLEAARARRKAAGEDLPLAA